MHGPPELHSLRSSQGKLPTAHDASGLPNWQGQNRLHSHILFHHCISHVPSVFYQCPGLSSQSHPLSSLFRSCLFSFLSMSMLITPVIPFVSLFSIQFSFFLSQNLLPGYSLKPLSLSCWIHHFSHAFQTPING